MTAPARCARCGRGPLAPRPRTGSTDVPNRLQHRARGLCNNCHKSAAIDGTLLDYPREKRPRDELLDDVRLLLEQGHTRRQIAERLGMRPDSLYRALRRAELAGVAL